MVVERSVELYTAGVYRPPRISDFNFPSVNLAFETCNLLLQKQ